MIRARGVRKRYHDGAGSHLVLDGVDLEIERGELVAIVGASGSGKSTLLNLVGGLDTDYEGEIEVCGKQLRALDDDALSRLRNRTVAFVFQSFNLLSPLTAEENVLLPTWFDPEADPEPELVRRAREALSQVGLEEKAARRPDRLSGGERQRVAIARALMMSPDLLLCDEPTGNLDAKTGEGIIDLFETLHRAGQTLLMVTHEARVSERASRVLRLEDGRLEPGRPGEGAR